MLAEFRAPLAIKDSPPRATLPRPVAVAYLVSVCLGMVLVLFRESFLPARFDYDAKGIQRLVEYPYLADTQDFGAFADIANLYSLVGVGTNGIAAGTLTFSLYCVLILAVALRLSRVPDSTIPVLAVPIVVLIGAIFLGTYTKELLVVILVFLVVLLPGSIIFDAAFAVGLFLFGYFVRPYWMIIAGVYVVYRWYAYSGRRPWNLFYLTFLATMVVSLGIWLLGGHNPDYFRVSVNEFREAGLDSRTLIPEYVQWTQPLGGLVNNLITLTFMYIPLPLLFLGTAYHGLIFLVISASWIAFLVALRRANSATASAHIIRAATVVMAFVTVQSVFEPDFGSVLRHLTPLLPLMLLVILQLVDSPPIKQLQADSAKTLEEPPPRHTTDGRRRPKQEPRSISNSDIKESRSIPMSQTQAPAAESFPSRVLHRVIRYFWLLIITAVVGAGIGWGVASSMKKEYSASVDLFVTAARDISENQAYQQSMFFQNRLTSYSQLINSDVLLQRVIDDLHLQDNPAELSKKIVAKPKPETVLMTITTTDYDAKRAADISNSAASALMSMVKELDAGEPQPVPATGEPEWRVNPQTGEWEEIKPEPTMQPGQPLTKMTVINVAKPSDTPSAPSVVKYVLIGAGLGLAVGLLILVIWTYLDRTIRSRTALEQALGVPVLGEIVRDDSLNQGVPPNYHAESTPATEAFRSLRTNLRFVNVDNPPKSVIITSCAEAEGKTTTVLNLAAALAAEGLGVCVIDADLRRPTVAKYLGASIEPMVGLSTVLSGACDVEDATQSYEEAGFDVIASGQLPPNPAEMLSSRSWQQFLDTVTEKYDFVIIDGPPVLPVTDSALIASTVDGVLLAAKYSGVKEDDLALATESLAAVDAKVFGSVLTQVPAKALPKSAYSSYHHGSSRQSS